MKQRKNRLDTYPKDYFDLFGSGKDLDLVEIDDIDTKLDDISNVDDVIFAYEEQ